MLPTCRHARRQTKKTCAANSVCTHIYHKKTKKHRLSHTPCKTKKNRHTKNQTLQTQTANRKKKTLQKHTLQKTKQNANMSMTTHPWQRTIEEVNAYTVLTPWLVTIALILSDAPQLRNIATLVGWTAHAPVAIAYHLSLAYNAQPIVTDVMLRMDQTMQLFAAVTNMLAQSNGNILITLVFTAMCLHFVATAKLWDVTDLLDENDGTTRYTVIAAAVITSCIPMIFHGNTPADHHHIPEFCIAVAAFLIGGAMVVFVKHPAMYTPFHITLGVFAWALIANHTH